MSTTNKQVLTDEQIKHIADELLEECSDASGFARAIERAVIERIQPAASEANDNLVNLGGTAPAVPRWFIEAAERIAQYVDANCLGDWKLGGIQKRIAREPNPPRYSYGPGKTWVVLTNPEDRPPYATEGTQKPDAGEPGSDLDHLTLLGVANLLRGLDYGDSADAVMRVHTALTTADLVDGGQPNAPFWFIAKYIGPGSEKSDWFSTGHADWSNVKDHIAKALYESKSCAAD